MQLIQINNYLDQIVRNFQKWVIFSPFSVEKYFFLEATLQLLALSDKFFGRYNLDYARLNKLCYRF